MTGSKRFAPDDPLAPPRPAFAEPWQAQAMALADGLVQAGHISATHWAETLGDTLRKAEASGAPDTETTYYTAVLDALDSVSAELGIDAKAQAVRRAEWEHAYLTTPHGQPLRRIGEPGD